MTNRKIDTQNIFFSQIDLRRCAVWNEDQSGGSWDATFCTTVLTEQLHTVCECREGIYQMSTKSY
jgi:hypothetical protein